MAKRRRAPALPRFPADVLAAVNTMERSTDVLAVATAALVHHAFTFSTVPDYHGAMRAERHADVVLAALWRRGMLIDTGCQ